ncbi:MAG: FAD:protein FMN transferase [Oscillospiraceae bacterium]|nr:FAD:protein FMN transferase [Oscillospiraceae bacterium]
MAFLIWIASLTGCGNRPPESQSATIFAMDTVMTITVYGEEAQEALRQATAEINRLETLFSVTRTESDLARINAADGKAVLVSPETAEVLTLAIALWEETDGTFSPGLYALQRAWGFTVGEYRVPEDAEIADLLAQVDVAEIRIDGLTVTAPPGMELDFGAIAKGYAADRLVLILRNLEIESAIISLGGDILALGERPGGAPWRVAVNDPFGHGSLGIIEVRDRAVNTSGNYERRFMSEEGETIHHILDPETGRPARSGLVSVTTVTADGARGDALATALFVMGLPDALAFVDRTPDLEAVFVTDDGRIYATRGLENMFVPEDAGRVSWS